MQVELRKYRKADLSRHLALLMMNQVYKKIDNKILGQEKIWLDKVIRNYSRQKPEFYVLAIILKNKLIGNLIAEKINYRNKSLEIGFWVGKQYWNKGHATEALSLFLKRIERKFKPEKIYAAHKKGNLASGRVLKKAGFKLLKESSVRYIVKAPF